MNYNISCFHYISLSQVFDIQIYGNNVRIFAYKGSWYWAFYSPVSVKEVEGRMVEVQLLRPDLSYFLSTFIDLSKNTQVPIHNSQQQMCTLKENVSKSEQMSGGGTQWAVISLHPWEVQQPLVDLRWYETWWTHTVYSQWGLHAGPMSPPDTASSQTLPPRKCPQGSAHLCRGGMAAYQVSGPKKHTHTIMTV